MFRVSGLGARVRVLGFGQLSMGIDWEIGLQRHQGPDLHFNSRSGLLTHSFRGLHSTAGMDMEVGFKLSFNSRELSFGEHR